MGSCPRRYSIALRIVSLSTEVLVELCQICSSKKEYNRTQRQPKLVFDLQNRQSERRKLMRPIH
ncbi:hypothetical protein T03_15558 [Trichinella britovi]|uniref:Uncharacterized protein n=2 Tax=Trichinella TaxID=6333 RepID=A0A0V1CND8_TRIBR|nr:hypothetical protein T05_5261 [Trichinella murrelli]KRX63175.1 hypothetical protein T09_3070 [Trichinella sp. T9]KRY50800.1 hypothetical protein T03_15558 [Trichinella britovi]